MIGLLTRFAGVGVAATLVHVAVALLADALGLPPQPANFLGFLAAVSLSYFGHGRFTFGVDLEHDRHMPRFLATAFLGLVLSAGLTQLLAVWMALPFALAMAVVAVAVPGVNFLLCKLWVFRPDHSGRA